MLKKFLFLFILLSFVGGGCLYAQKIGKIQKQHLQKNEAKVLAKTCSPNIRGKEYVVDVQTQVGFENLDQTIRYAIKRGYTNINIRLTGNLYFYRDNHLNLNGINNQNLSIRIEGNGAKLIAKGNNYSKENNLFSRGIDYGHCFLTNQFDYLDFNSQYNQLLAEVEVVNEKKKLCRIRTSLHNQDAAGASIQLNEWYMVKTYPIIKIKGGYIYFTATDLEYVKARNCYNVNYDYGISKIMPRYVIKNLRNVSHFSIYKGRMSFPQGVDSIHECTDSQFLVLYKNIINYFQLKGVEFIGNSDKEQLLYIRNVKANKVEITDCTFKYIKSTILRCDYADNVCFRNNVVENCFGRGIWSRNDCNHTTITGNQFYKTIKTVDQSSCVTCYSENFYIADNVFKDFGGIAISVGLKYTQKQTSPISGIIENNEIYYSQAYHDFMKHYSLIDGGAIYISTQNDETIIRYNYIHGYTGLNSRRSIYCDDGCYNTKIYGNIIRQPENTDNAIFQWLSNNTSKSNSSIDFMYNVIWGKYKMEERSQSDCVHGKNVIIYTGKRPQNVLKNFAAQEEDVFVNEPMLRNSLKELSPETMKAIMSLPTYQGMKKWFE